MALNNNRGTRNFRNCTLKQTNTRVTSGSGVSNGPLRVQASLETCPTIEDQNTGPLRIQATNTLNNKPEAQSRNAQKRLANFCGGSICNDCVYVGMENPVQVSMHRKEEADAARVAVESQIMLQRAVAELDAMKNPVVE